MLGKPSGWVNIVADVGLVLKEYGVDGYVASDYAEVPCVLSCALQSKFM